MVAKASARHGHRSPTHPTRVRITTEQQAQMSQMRAAGATYREIGAAFDVSETTVRNRIIDMLERVTYENATLLRTQEAERLDRLQRAIWADAIAGRLGAIDRVLKIMEVRAKLFGLYAPDEVNITLASQEDDNARSVVESRIDLMKERRANAIEAQEADEAAEAKAPKIRQRRAQRERAKQREVDDDSPIDLD